MMISHFGIISSLYVNNSDFATCNNDVKSFLQDKDILMSFLLSCFHSFTKICLLNFLVPSYLITCHNCGHGTDLRGCPQAPLSIEGMHSLCQLLCSQYQFEFLIQFILAYSWVLKWAG